MKRKILNLLLLITSIILLFVSIILILKISNIKTNKGEVSGQNATTLSSSNTSKSIDNKDLIKGNNDGINIANNSNSNTSISLNENGSDPIIIGNKIRTKASSKIEDLIMSNASSESNRDEACFDYPRTKAKYLRKLMYGKKKAKEKVVYLTFDDGPSKTVTSQVLDILKENDVHATFFYYTLGDISELKGVIDRTIEEGHSIGLHSNSHKYEVLYPNRHVDIAALLSDLKTCIEKIRAVRPGFDTNVFRFPGGSMSWDGIDEAIDAVSNWGVEFIDWNALTGDSDSSNKDKSPEGLVDFMDYSISLLENKDTIVVLMHDAEWNYSTAPGLQKVIDYFKERGYKFGIIE